MTTVFIRAIEAPVDEKAATLSGAVRGQCPGRFARDISSFKEVPRSPFAYWVGDATRRLFASLSPLESEGRVARRTNGTTDDGRWIRAFWEPEPKLVSDSWVLHLKGGEYSPYYADAHLVVAWDRDRESYPGYLGTVHRPDVRPASLQYFFRPGLTWSRRTQKGLSLRAMPPGCIFGDKGPGVFIDGNDPGLLCALLALMNTSAFRGLVELQMAFGSYEAGVIQRTPVPRLGDHNTDLLSRLAHRVWSSKRRLDSRVETSHAFLLPALLQAHGDDLTDRAQSWSELTSTTQAEVDTISAEIDEHAYRLYGISGEDRQRIEQGFGGSGELEDVQDDDDGDETEEQATEVDAAPMVASLLSWSVGAAFGRFDVRLAIGERAVPPEPEPFDPLPVCSPGMLTGDDGLPLAAPPAGYPLTFPTDGILVDDPGHARDLVSALHVVFDTVFDDANARWHEAAEILGVPDLRTWFARDFFELHIKRYSKSRRKAPIYWQLATASGSYSIWFYIRRATSDTLFRVLNDFVGPKLDHEKAKLDGLTQEAGGTPSAAQRREIEQQETFVGELQAFKNEGARVAPLWKPNLDDGVIINFAPLWRLVPQSRSWQSECKKAWDKLQAGDYDWAHLAMHLWPERVVPKCIDDRSLAIAHGLEAVFWQEGESGKWEKREVAAAAVQALIAERTSSSVKAALKDLLSAPTPTTSKGRTAKGRGSASRSAALKPAPASARVAAAAPTPTVDEPTLSAVKSAIASQVEGASKADVLAATSISDADWNNAIAALLNRGEITRTGQRRGTRYHANRGEAQ